LASQAIQVFYVVDPKDPDWSTVVKVRPRYFYDVMDDSDGFDIDGYYLTPNLDDPTLDNQELQIRIYVRGVYVNKILSLHNVNDTIPEADNFNEEEDETSNDDEI